MRVLLVGHSYVRELKKLCYTKFTTENTTFYVEYLYRAGGDYCTFLEDTSLLDFAEEYQPNYVIVILAGNAINNDISPSDLYYKARKFYSLLKEKLPDSKIIAAQPELRYYKKDNQWNAPEPDEYLQRRSAFNNFLRRCKENDAIMLIDGRLDQGE